MPDPVTQISKKEVVEIGEILYGKKVKVQAMLTSIRHHKIKNGSIMTDGVIGDASGSVKCVWFSKAPLTDLKVGNEYVFEGYLENKYGRIALQKPTYNFVRENQQDYDPVPLSAPAVKPYSLKRSWWDDIDLGGLVWIVIILGVIAYFIFTHIQQQHLRASGVTCKDVTSIDYNWNNDVLCTRPNGSTFYTDYAGGNKYGYSFPN